MLRQPPAAMKRKLSLALAALAYLGFPLWAYIESAQFAAAMERERGWVCGMPIMAIYILAVLGSGLASMGSLALGAWAYRGLPMPRPGSRRVELVVVALPMALLLFLLALIAISDTF